jgi:hypothetical protein
MKTTIFLILGLTFGLFLSSCQDRFKTSKTKLADPISEGENLKVISPRLYYAPSGYAYTLPDTINNRPISFYLDNPNVADIAKQLYLNKFRPTDNDSTTILLSLVSSQDSVLRPFYRWCLDFVIQISDGALGEYPGQPAFNYATTYPNEFFAYMDNDTTGLRYKKWTEIIAYSGLNVTSLNDFEQEKFIITSMTKNCINCNSATKKRINKFSADIVKAIHLAD